jgi:1-phosphofructokinase
LTVTVERRGQEDEIHVHAGGQGYWLARLIRALGLDVTLCATFGGETGRIARNLLESEGFDVRPVTTEGSNGAYIHDRRSGERQEIASMRPTPLSRHEADELYGASLVAALRAAVCVLGGPSDPEAVAPELYGRLATDLRSNDKVVVADLSGELLETVLGSGVTVVKVSDDELIRHGYAAGPEEVDLVEAMQELVAMGAESVIVSRAEMGALGLLRGRFVEASAPQLQTVDARGAGDSLTAGVACALARGESFEAALQLGVAAGALNVTRRGLGSGHRDDIERLAECVEVRPFSAEMEPRTRTGKRRR